MSVSVSRIERNGISGLCLRVVVITLAAVAFGCAPKVAQTQADGAAPIVVAAR